MEAVTIFRLIFKGHFVSTHSSKVSPCACTAVLYKNNNSFSRAQLDKVLTYASETWTLTERDRKQLNVFERKVYRRILGPVYDNEKKTGGY